MMVKKPPRIVPGWPRFRELMSSQTSVDGKREGMIPSIDENGVLALRFQDSRGKQG